MTMHEAERFEEIAAEEFPNAIPEKFRHKIHNVAFLVEDEPSAELRAQEDLAPDETLLGYYHGIPATARGDLYGIGNSLPDTITLFRLPIEDEAHFLCAGDMSQYEVRLRQVIRETIWHEVAHYFGMDEHEVRTREHRRDGKEE